MRRGASNGNRRPVRQLCLVARAVTWPRFLVGWVVVACIGGALFWRRLKQGRADELPICGHCMDVGAVVILEARPMLQFCNFCVLGRAYDRAANPPVDWQKLVARCDYIEPSGGQQ